MTDSEFDNAIRRHAQHNGNFAPLPVNWQTLTAPETQLELEELAAWTTWLLDRYQLDYRTLPPCWERHGALIEELSALRTGWLTSYAREAKGDAPLHWHNDFAAARQRLTDWTARTGCRPAEHRQTN